MNLQVKIILILGDSDRLCLQGNKLIAALGIAEGGVKLYVLIATKYLV
jgi:hypothetical protein